MELSNIFSKTFETYLDLYEEYGDKKGKWKNKKINFDKYTDTHISGGFHESSKIDIFFGKKRMFIMIHCSEKLRQKFNEELFKIAKIPKLLRN